MFRFKARLWIVAAIWLGGCAVLRAELPGPVLHCVFPAGAQAGSSVTVSIEGIALEGLRALRSTAPGFSATQVQGNKFSVSIAESTPPGIYDLCAVTDYGISNPRAFLISRLTEKSEGDANDRIDVATPVEMNSVINGKLEKPGDVDWFHFAATAGERIVIDCWAERIDSQLRAVIEVLGPQGERLAVSRSFTGLDPLVDLIVPADGFYDVRLFDLSYLGSSSHFYRLEVSTQPRPEFALPCIVERGKTTRVRLFGRNLLPNRVSASMNLDVVEVDVDAPSEPPAFIPVPRPPAQIASDVFAYVHPGTHMPLAIGLTDIPVIENTTGHNRLDRPLEVSVPCEVSAQLTELGGQHWYAFQAQRGEVIWFEGFGDRLGSPVDLEFSILDSDGKRELSHCSDQTTQLGGYRFSTLHTDPTGRWIAPADGRYLLLVRNLAGGAEKDPRRIYRLSVRREEPDYQLAVVSRRTDQPAAWNVARGGRELMEVLVLRRRGMAGPIHVTAADLPTGMDCPDVWIGPGQDRAPLVITAARDSAIFDGAVRITGNAEQGGLSMQRLAHGGTMIWSGRPVPSGRLSNEVTVATAMDAPLLLTAIPKSSSLDQESMLDVEVSLESLGGIQLSAARLSCVGLPRGVTLESTSLPEGATKTWMGLFWPAALPSGNYTFAVQAQLEAMVALKPSAKPAKTSLTVISNPITIEVKPARIVLEIDPTTPTKIARGRVIQLRFTAERVNGFLGKIHAELTAPEGVTGLRARGVTLTGQSDGGSLQVIATDNAPLGRHALLRLDAVGTVEDQPAYRASRPVELEIVE